MALNALAVIFLNLSLRLYTLRASAISSLLMISASVQWTLWFKTNVPGGFWVILYTLIAFHQIMSTFQWPILYGMIDLPILIAELIGAGYYANTFLLKSWFPETLVFHVILAWIVVGTLSLTMCFRIADIIYSRGRSLTRPFDILAHEPKDSRSKILEKGWRSTFHLLLGRSIWKKNFVGETVSIRTVRGILAIIVLSAIFFYTLLNVIFAPIKETALSPVRTYCISGIAPTDLLDDTYIPAWRVTYLLAEQLAPNGTNITTLIPPDVFFSAVTVYSVWPAGWFDPQIQECHQQDPIPDITFTSFYYQYLCLPYIYDNGTNFLLPDLYISVNFSLLFSGLSGLEQFSARTQLPLVIGLSNDTFNDFSHTVPVTLIPGANIVAPYILGIRQVYSNRILAAIGIFEATISFYIPQIMGLYTDPTANFIGPSLASLNIFYQSNYGETNFIQDYREKSVMAGLSSVGGLWTAFSGLFAILFGASMLHIFYGSKPLSIFGVAHKFHAEAMKKECLEKYPQILTENSVPETRGLLSLLRDHLINLDFVEDQKDDLGGSDVQEKQIDVESAPISVEQVPVQRQPR